MTRFICFFVILIGFCAYGFCQVPTGTGQRDTKDTLIRKPVPGKGKYNSRSTKWPKRDSLKTFPAKRESGGHILCKYKKNKGKQKN
jgi:hypothetical protein